MASLLQRMQTGHMRGVVKELMHGAPPTALPPETEDAGFEGMLAWHARSRWFEVNGQFSEAYVARMKSIDVLLPASSQGVLGPDTVHLVPVLRAFLNSLRDLCVALDDAAKSTAAEPDEHLGKFVKTVATLYASVKNDDDRNFACICLYIVGWQIAYQLNTTTVVAKWRLPDLTYKLADQVTRNYWEGLVAFSSNNWPAAAANLAYAFHTTPARFHRHRRIILTLLIPAKLACCLAKQSEGAFPSARLLHKYNLPELAQLVAAFQVGNVRAFERNLLEHESLYVRKKIFVQLTKLRLLLYRNIIKRACILVAAANAGAGRIQMEDMLCVCVAAGWDVDAAELECVVGVLIRRGHIKGQLDKERGAIMLSKRTPFPRAAALSLS